MKKLKQFIIFTICITFFYVPIIKAEEYYSYLNITDIEELSDIQANHILLLNLNDQKIIYEKNPQEKIKIASLTKL